MTWLFIIGGFLVFGFIVDYIAKKRNINLSPDEGAKNASESERVYVESYMHNLRQDSHNSGL